MKNTQDELCPLTVLLTGLPRAGTTLSCHILNQHDNVLALHEPFTPTDFKPELGRRVAVDSIQNFALVSRHRALFEGKALSRQRDGSVPENPVEAQSNNALRALDVSLADIAVGDRIKNPDFTLVIKHNALFTGLLPELSERFPVYAIVRNPLSVLASWNSVDLPVNQGRIPAGELYCPELKLLLDGTSDRVLRQLHILEWFCDRFFSHINTSILRYEDFVIDPAIIGEKLRLPSAYSGEVQTRNSRNQSYDLRLMEELYKKLQGFGDAIWQFYSSADLDNLMDGIASGKRAVE